MDLFFLAVAAFVAVLFTASAVYALHWSSKNGQLRDFEKGAASIFDDSEPVGQTTDSFPTKRRKKALNR